MNDETRFIPFRKGLWIPHDDDRIGTTGFQLLEIEFAIGLYCRLISIESRQSKVKGAPIS